MDFIVPRESGSVFQKLWVDSGRFSVPTLATPCVSSLHKGITEWYSFPVQTVHKLETTTLRRLICTNENDCPTVTTGGQ